MFKYFVILPIAFFASFATVSPAAKFTISELKFVPGAINENGDVVGQGAGGLTVFKNGITETTPVDHVGSTPVYYSFGYSINDWGYIVGGGYWNGYDQKSFVMDKYGLVKDLNTLFTNPVYAGKINNSGLITVNSGGSAYVFDNKNGILKEAPSLYRYYLDFPYDLQDSYKYTTLGNINDTGVAVGSSNVLLGGYHAIMFDINTGLTTDLTTYFDDPSFYEKNSSANDINENGVIVGNYDGKAFVYDHGLVKFLAPVPFYNDFHESIYASAINDSGAVVGNGCDIDFGFFTCDAFYNKNGKMQLLLDLVSNPSGWELANAVDINNSGQIIGTGFFNGHLAGFILNPLADGVPEPQNWALLILGFGAVGTAVRLQKQKKSLLNSEA